MKKTQTSEFEGERPSQRVFSQSILTNWREDEREEAKKPK